jgi:BNR repeat-like domain
VPKQCPTTTPARDMSFGDSVMLPTATSATATLAADGKIWSGPPASLPLGPTFEPIECAEASDCERIHVSATKTRDGRLHVVALKGGIVGGFGSAQYRVEYTVSSDGGATYSPPIAISGRDEMLPFYFARPVIVVDARRRWIYAAYVRGGHDARWDIVIAASKDNGATWKRTTVAGDGCAIHMVPSLAVDAFTGTLHVAYYDSEGAVGRFAHASCGPGVTKCKLHGAINSVPFATLSTAREPRKSIGDVATLVVDDRRRVLHAVWAQRVDDAGNLVTRFFHAQAKLKK